MGSQVVSRSLSRTFSSVGVQGKITSADMGWDLSRTVSSVGLQRNITSTDVGLDPDDSAAEEAYKPTEDEIDEALKVFAKYYEYLPRRRGSTRELRKNRERDRRMRWEMSRTVSLVELQRFITSADVGLDPDNSAAEEFAKYNEYLPRRRGSTRRLEREKELERTCDGELRKNRERDLPEASGKQEEDNGNAGRRKRRPEDDEKAVACEVGGRCCISYGAFIHN